MPNPYGLTKRKICVISLGCRGGYFNKPYIVPST